MPSIDSYNIKKPQIKDDNWIVFPDTIFSHINTMDCTDAMEGKCYTDKTFDQCIDICDKSPECNYGYYISNLPGENICVPLRDKNSDSNPLYRLRKKSLYPEMENARTRVFVNKKQYQFPPEEANTVFFMDNFLIQNIETGYFLETSEFTVGNENVGVKLDTKGDLIVQPLQVPPDLSAGTQYVTVKYGDQLVFNIPNTTLIMKESGDRNKMDWNPRDYNISNDVSYTLIPVTPSKKIGDVVNYSDSFSIHTNNSILGVDSHSFIEKIYYSDYKHSKDSGYDVTFKFIPKMKGWYCNNDAVCTEISLEKMTVNDKGIGTYDGFAIGRNPGCFGVCKYKIKNQPHLQRFDNYTNVGYTNQNNNYVWVILISSIVLIGSLIFIFRSKRV
jgi:hypothetical protein